MKTKIYHNPRCSKSRAAIQLLDDHGVDYEVVKYLEEPPTEKELAAILGKLGMEPHELVRRKEPLFRELELAGKTLTAQEWIRILVEHPKLIERPIVIHGKKAAIGRPTESIEAILDS